MISSVEHEFFYITSGPGSNIYRYGGSANEISWPTANICGFKILRFNEMDMLAQVNFGVHDNKNLM